MGLSKRPMCTRGMSREGGGSMNFNERYDRWHLSLLGSVLVQRLLIMGVNAVSYHSLIGLSALLSSHQLHYYKERICTQTQI